MHRIAMVQSGMRNLTQHAQSIMLKLDATVDNKPTQKEL